jgi:hypothetical protein
MNSATNPKFLFPLLLFCFLLSQSAFAGAIISDFHGEPGFNRVDLKWIVSAESNLKGYQVLRSMDGNHFETIAMIAAKKTETGEKTYHFQDTSVFKQTGRSFYYRLKLENDDGTTSDYDKVLVISPQISAARQTWGSIKAMFR